MISKVVQENNKEKNPLPEIIHVKTVTQAENLVRKLKKDGYNPREILKMKIMVGEKKFPLNIFKINQIAGIQSIHKEKTEITDADFFSLYEQGFTPNDVVCILNCSFDKADTAFVKFQKYSGKVLVSAKDQNTLFTELKRINPFVKTLADVIPDVKMMLDVYILLLRNQYRCGVCGEKIMIGSAEMPDIVRHFEEEGWSHSYCLKGNN